MLYMPGLFLYSKFGTRVLNVLAHWVSNVACTAFCSNRIDLNLLVLCSVSAQKQLHIIAKFAISIIISVKYVNR